VLFRRGVATSSAIAGMVAVFGDAAADHRPEIRDRLKSPAGQNLAERIGVDFGLCRDLRGQQTAPIKPIRRIFISLLSDSIVSRSFNSFNLPRLKQPKSSFFAFWGWKAGGIGGRALAQPSGSVTHGNLTYCYCLFIFCYGCVRCGCVLLVGGETRSGQSAIEQSRGRSKGLNAEWAKAIR